MYVWKGRFFIGARVGGETMNYEEDAGVIPGRRGRPPKNSTNLRANGSGERKPRQKRNKHVQDVPPEQSNIVSPTPQETFPAQQDEQFPIVGEIKKDIYRTVLELLDTATDEEARHWQIITAVLEYAVTQLDAERRGIAITYATLMPARTDGIHSLYEVAMRGTEPWPFSFEGPAYLGSTTLAGAAAMNQRLLTWDTLDEAVRSQFEVDEYEKSACACPVTRIGRIAGVLIVSSAQSGFFSSADICQAVVDYARLLSLALRDDMFYPYSYLQLVPMPLLKMQREEVRKTLVPRVLSCARTYNLSRSEAEARVRLALELEFEEQVQSQRR
jgi:hypothetical protein